MSNLLASYYLKKNFQKKNFIYLKIITNKNCYKKRSKKI